MYDSGIKHSGEFLQRVQIKLQYYKREGMYARRRSIVKTVEKFVDGLESDRQIAYYKASSIKENQGKAFEEAGKVSMESRRRQGKTVD